MIGNRSARDKANKIEDGSRVAFTFGSVTSRDGTVIGYRQTGKGPGVVLLHGMFESSKSHTQLGTALADSYTIYLPDCRGRGLGGPHHKDDAIGEEVEDLRAVIDKTGANYLFGVSVGATVCLRAAVETPGIQKIAVYDPALSIDGSVPTGFLERFDKEMEQRQLASALVTGMKGAWMGRPFFYMMPRWVLKMFPRRAIASEDRKAKEGDVTMRKMAPTMSSDFHMVIDASKGVKDFRSIQAEALLLGGPRALPTSELRSAIWRIYCPIANVSC